MEILGYFLVAALVAYVYGKFLGPADAYIGGLVAVVWPVLVPLTAMIYGFVWIAEQGQKSKKRKAGG